MCIDINSLPQMCGKHNAPRPRPGALLGGYGMRLRRLGDFGQKKTPPGEGRSLFGLEFYRAAAALIQFAISAMSSPPMCRSVLNSLLTWAMSSYRAGTKA